MSKQSSPDPNINLATRQSACPVLTVRPISPCGACKQPATVLVGGYAARCQKCANKVVNIWSEMRGNLLEALHPNEGE